MLIIYNDEFSVKPFFFAMLFLSIILLGCGQTGPLEPPQVNETDKMEAKTLIRISDYG